MPLSKLSPSLKQASGTLKSLLAPVKKLLSNPPLSPMFLMTAALMLFFLLVLSACSTTKTAKPTLPAEAQPRTAPKWHGKTYRDAMKYVAELKEYGRQCEADKAAIRYVFKEEAP